MAALSVLTLVKNREPHLLRQIEGLHRSLVRPGELIIVKMGYEPLPLPAAEFPVHVLELASDGLPLAQARNLAAARAGFEKLLFLDIDCIPMRGLLGAIDNALAGADRLICAEVRYLAADDLGADWDEDDLLRKAAPHPVRNFPEYGLVPETNYGLFWSLAFAIRRDRFRALGGFDERFAGYGAEDTEFAFRARDAGIGLGFLGNAVALHQHHAVYDPPLQHFADIALNAQRFFDLRGGWPMPGWLDAFEAMGLIAIQAGKLRVLRHPTARELAAARQPDSERF
jgi:hypothetical protein